MKRALTLLTIVIVALCSCNRSLEVATPSQGTMFTVSAAPFYGEPDASATKSAYFNESDSHKITDFNVWVYDFSTGELVNGGGQYKTYFTDPREVNGYYLFPDFSKKYEIYMLANLGKQDAPLTRADAEAYRYKFSNYDTFKTKGFPMAAHYCFVPSDPSTSHNLQLMRLVSRFNIQFKFGEDNNYDFVLKEAVVRNSAKAVSPFAKESKANDAGDVILRADKLSVSELSANGGEVYMIENIQGDNVFKDPVKRTADNMTRERLKYCTTYLEFSGELNRKDGTGYRNVRCLYYFGEGTFAGVRRNYNTPIVLTMTNTFTDNNNWTVEPMDPYSDIVVKFDTDDPYEQLTQNIKTLLITKNSKAYRMFGRAFFGDAYADDVNYKYVFDEKTLNIVGVTVKILYPNDGGQKAFGQFGKGPSLIGFVVGDTFKGEAEVEFKAVDKNGIVLGKFEVRVFNPYKVIDINIREADRTIYYKSRNPNSPNYPGTPVRIKLNVTPENHTSRIGITKNSDPGSRLAGFRVDDAKDELVIIPRKLGKVSITLSADGRDFDFDFWIKQKVNLSVSDVNYDLSVKPDVYPLRPLKFSASGTLGGSVQINNGRTYENIEDYGSFRENHTINSSEIFYPQKERINEIIRDIERKNYPSWEIINAEDTYAWVDFYIYPSYLDLFCEVDASESVVDGEECIEAKIQYDFFQNYFRYATYEYVPWGYGFGAYRGRATVKIR